MVKKLTEEHYQTDPMLAHFVEDLHGVIERRLAVTDVVAEVSSLVKNLLAAWRMSDVRYLEFQKGRRYGSYLLYRAPDASFVVVIDTFGEGQSTQIHNHRTWAVVGLLGGAERNQIYRAPDHLEKAPKLVTEQISRPGEVFTLLEPEMHRLYTDLGAGSQSFHVYGADVGTIRRLAWDESTERYVEFRQGWSNDAVGLPIYLDCPAMTEQELRRQCAGYL